MGMDTNGYRLTIITITDNNLNLNLPPAKKTFFHSLSSNNPSPAT